MWCRWIVKFLVLNLTRAKCGYSSYDGFRKKTVEIKRNIACIEAVIRYITYMATISKPVRHKIVNFSYFASSIPVIATNRRVMSICQHVTTCFKSDIIRSQQKCLLENIIQQNKVFFINRNLQKEANNYATFLQG